MPRATDRPLAARPEPPEVCPCLCEAQSPVRAAAHDVGIVVVLAVVLPNADRADLEPATLAEREASTARTPQGQLGRLFIAPGALSEPREPAGAVIR